MPYFLLFILATALLPAADAYAQKTASTTFRVTARVDALCEVTASDLAFGTYSAQSGTALVGTTGLQVTCTPNSSYQVGLDQGTSPGATVTTRRMVSGANNLNYQLYSDAQRSRNWGNTPGTDTVVGVGTGAAQDLTVFGSVPAKQVVPAGDYGDTITVRVFY